VKSPDSGPGREIQRPFRRIGGAHNRGRYNLHPGASRPGIPLPPLFVHPLGLFALLAVPIVIGLHLFRRRFRRHVVSAVFLWEAQDRAPIAGRKREPLHTSPSFWCEVLAALLLALAFAGPRLFGAGEAVHMVAVLDASASMGALTPDGSVADEARAEIAERIESLPRGSRVTIVASGPRPRVLAGPAAFVQEASSKLEEYEPTAARHDLSSSIALALQLAGDGMVMLVTDRYEPERWPEEIEVLSVGRAADNIAITNATRRRERDPESDEIVEKVRLTLTSYSSENATIQLVLRAGEVEQAQDGVPQDIGPPRFIAGAEVASSSLELTPGGRRHLTFTLPPGSPPIEARISPDALEIDDFAWLAPVPPRTLALSSTLPTEVARHIGLVSGESAIGKWLQLVPDAIELSDPSGAHIVLSQGTVPGTAWALSFEPPGANAKHLIGPFLIDKRHALLEGVTLEGIVWTAWEDLQLVGAPIVSAGNLPLVTEERLGERTVFRFGLDPLRSSLHRSPDWPILLANLAELRRRELPGPARTNLALGETFLYRARAAAEYVFEGEGQRMELRSRATLAVEDVERPGLYTLSTQGKALCTVGYSFVDPAESDLQGLLSGRRAGSANLATILAGFTWLELLLLTLGLALIVIDWIVLSRVRLFAGTGPGI